MAWWARLLIGIAVFIGVAIIGFVGQIIATKRKKDEADFLEEYFKNFVEFCKGKKESYGLLLEQFNRAQELLGVNGILDSIKFPFENAYHRNFPVLALINNLKDSMESLQSDANYLDAKNANAMVDMVQTAFLRTIGDYNNDLIKTQKRILNPFISFYKGFYWLVASPFVALSYMFCGANIFTQNKYRVLNIIFRVIALLIQAIGFISAIMGIVLGWEEFANLFR